MHPAQAVTLDIAREVNLRDRERQSGGRTNIWDVFCGSADPDDLDEAGQEMLREICNPPGPSANHPLVKMLRGEWARLGISDPGEYRGVDLVEEMIRVVGLPTPTPTVAQGRGR